MTTPPGWYSDPGHSGNGPALERWWDGEKWGEQTRPAGFAPQSTAPLTPAWPPAPPAGRGPRGPLIAGIVAAVAVVAALIFGGFMLFGPASSSSSGPGDKQDEAQQQPEPRESGKGDGPSEAPPEGQIVPARGVVLPVLDGWNRQPGAGGSMVGIGQYDCPGETGERCLRGAALLMEAGEGSSGPEAVARADIEEHARSSYSEEVYGGITSHEVLLNEKVKVAGQDGFRVRWKIDNEVDPDAYVESVAFPHPDGSGRMLVLRTGFDIHRDSPPLSAMDELIEGIEQGTVEEDDNSKQV